jgi:arginine decarboxylase-like protein
MGFASLKVLTDIVEKTEAIRWKDDDETADMLAVVDSDITQAIQSCKEEIDQGQVPDMSEARDILKELRLSLGKSLDKVQSWGGEYPFGRAWASLDYWKF